ncbi:uncharacterized protein LOC144124272 [Amblyomma americanum]
MYCIYKDSMRGVTLLRPLCIVAVTVAICVEVEHVDGATADFCAGGSGVVKASRSASLGARILTKCGRSMVLKYTLPSKQFYKILTCTCIVTRLCYAHVVPNKNMGEFRRQITKCYMDYSKWFVHARPWSVPKSCSFRNNGSPDVINGEETQVIQLVEENGA